MSRFGKIGVLAGGQSSEREISLKSGKAVYDALLAQGLDGVLIDINSLEAALDTIKKAGLDTVFIALHGGFGEDGTMQALLDKAAIKYTGSGFEASRIAIDKLAAREALEANGMDVPECEVSKRDKEFDISSVRLPVVVKPLKGGSSIGLSTVLSSDNLQSALNNAFSYGDTALIERFISGRELTVSILDGRPLPVIEIISRTGSYDYFAKYESSSTEYLIPAPLDEDTTARAREIGIAAHKAIGCGSFSRVDMILSDDGAIYVLEVNTIPGLTSRSLLPKAALAVGIDFGSLCVKILEGASR